MLMTSLKHLYGERTNMKTSQLDALLTKELNLNTKMCLRNGLITGVVTPP